MPKQPRKVLLLEINWETGEANTTFFSGPDAFKLAEGWLNALESIPTTVGWSRSILYGPTEE